MWTVLAWLVGSRPGRSLSVAVLLLASVGLVWLAGRKSGDEARKVKDLADRLKAVKDKVRIDEEIRSMPADERRARLREWVRDNSG